MKCSKCQREVNRMWGNDGYYRCESCYDRDVVSLLAISVVGLLVFVSVAVLAVKVFASPTLSGTGSGPVVRTEK